MWSYVLVLLFLTVYRFGGVDGQGLDGGPHIHHGVERADVWGDVWVVNLRSGIDAQVCKLVNSLMMFASFGVTAHCC